MERYNLPAEWTSHEEEKALIAAIVQTPSLYWELIDILTDETFAAADTRQAWQGIAAAIEAEQAPVVPNGWQR